MALKLDNISKSFGNKSILDSFSYTFKNCGLYIISGESGVGKTTLLRIISNLDKDFSGTVENGGIENVSFMFQEYRLFPTLNALNNASISSKNGTYNDAELLLKRLGFSHEDMKKKPHQLSGGMKQRVTFARAVLMESPILLLDEPTKELDADTAKIITDVILEESAKRLVIAVTHDPELLQANSEAVIRL